MTFKILLLLGLVASALSTPAPVKVYQCPLITLKDAATCRYQHSECWNSGRGDFNCPNDSLCCFDGCVNKCKIPGELEVFWRPRKCRIEYKQKRKLVKMDHCVDVPDLQACTKSQKLNCRRECKTETSQRCGIVKKPIEAEAPDKKCSTQYKEVCENKVKQLCPDTLEGRAGIGCQNTIYNDCKKVPYEHCQHSTRAVSTYANENDCTPIEETKCHDVCEPDTINECDFEKTQKECKPIWKEVYYVIPVKKCEKLVYDDDYTDDDTDDYTDDEDDTDDETFWVY